MFVPIALLVCGLAVSCGEREKEQPARARSFIVPAVEIVAMDAAINFASRRWFDSSDYAVTAATIRRNLKARWIVEDDPFDVNQFLHPYQGAMYHNIARSSGLNYWQAMAYTLAGSALWEIAGETTPPSKNDQVASGLSGSLLGEPLFRTSRLVLFHDGKGPGFLRAVAATLISPPVGVNRALFGDRFESDAPGSVTQADLRLEIGATAPADDLASLGSSSPFIGFAVDYGYPGRATYLHARPFDYFRFEGVASSGGFQNVATRGLIAGRDFGLNASGRGVWGLYGGYDYFSPDLFRVSSTFASIGTTIQSHLSGSLTLQGSALAGAGYTAAQSLGASGNRDYHYGVAPQALASVRLIAGRRASLDATAREYFISDIGGLGTSRRDTIFRGDATLALRVFGKHGVAVKYQLAERRADRTDLSRLVQRRSTVGLFYTFLGSRGFGAIR